MNLKDGRRVFIKTFGCQMNELDSAKMLAALAARGYRAVDSPEEADLIVINTCSVREKAAQKARSDLGRFARLKRMRTDLVLVYVGCAAQHEARAALAREPGCDIVLGTGALDSLPELVEAVKSEGCRIVRVDGLGRDLFEGLVHRPAGPTAFVAAMRGCDNYCSYCIVPYVRGPEKSRPRPLILDEVRRLAEQGVREVTLLGQNVNSYGRGLYRSTMFPDLLRSVAGIDGIERVRFVTSHPKDLDSGLIDVMAEEPKVCESIHLPVQSGSDRVLEAMNRGYTAGRYEELVERLRERVPGIAVTSDLIVGFPGETDEDFELTAGLVKRIRFNDFFSFKYSPRPMTEASKWPDSVPEEVKRQRLARLHAMQRRIKMEHHRARIGGKLEVLVEGISKMGGQLMGRLRNGEIVNFAPRRARPGDLAMVAITGAHENSLSGEEQERDA